MPGRPKRAPPPSVPTGSAPRRKRGRPRKPGDFTRHVVRQRVIRQTPVHVTIKVLPRSARLRSTRRFRVIRQALIKGGLRFGFRLVHYSVQSNHLHLIGEAESTLSVSRAIKGLSVRIARRLNRLTGQRGPVIGERYHLRVIRDRHQARRCLVYVLNNARRHAAQRGIRLSPDYLDERSSARAFDGWSRRPDRHGKSGCPPDPCPDLPLGVHRPRSDLLVSGWRVRGGSIDPALVPGPFREQFEPTPGGIDARSAHETSRRRDSGARERRREVR